jgi:phosphoribosylanthranilate isomerase
MPRTRIKICGLTREADVAAAVEAGADAVGLMLWSGSARAITPARAKALAAALPPFVSPVLVMVNPSADEVQRAVDAVPHALLQFHGDERPGQCEALAAGRAFIRAVRMAEGVDLVAEARRYHAARALLLDAFAPGYGGAGKVFDWSRIPHDVPSPVVLSGGLNPANVTDGVLTVRPFAVDVSSGVEANGTKGVKDATLMRRFCQAVFEADARFEGR